MPWLFQWSFSSRNFLVATAPVIEVDNTLISGCGHWANSAELASLLSLDKTTPYESILAALYQKYGAAISAFQIAGNYCWILANTSENSVTICRDAAGLGTLYYAVRQTTIWISNSSMEILRACGEKPEIELDSLAAHVNGLAPDPGKTFFRSINSVPPGMLFLFNETSTKEIRYWSPAPQPILKLKSDQEYVDAYASMMRQVSAEYSPPGRAAVTLSSGLDTNSLAVFMRKNFPDRNITGLGFISPDFQQANEEEDILRVAELVDADLITLRQDQLWPLSRESTLSATPDGPTRHFFYDVWAEAYQRLRQAGVDFLQVGPGGDDLFGGSVYVYPDLLLKLRFRELVKQLQLHLPRSVYANPRVDIAKQMLFFPMVNWLRYYLLPERVLRVSTNPALTKKYHGWLAERYQSPASLPLMLPGRLKRFQQAWAAVNSQYYTELQVLANQCHFQVFAPFLDRRIFDFALSLPTEQTFFAGQRKAIMLRAMGASLPDSILTRIKKIVPYKIAVEGLLRRETNQIKTLLSNMRLAELGIVDEKILKKDYQDHLDGKLTNMTSFYYCITAEGWLRKWFP